MVKVMSLPNFLLPDGRVALESARAVPPPATGPLRGGDEAASPVDEAAFGDGAFLGLLARGFFCCGPLVVVEVAFPRRGPAMSEACCPNTTTQYRIFCTTNIITNTQSSGITVVSFSILRNLWTWGKVREGVCQSRSWESNDESYVVYCRPKVLESSSPVVVAKVGGPPVQ